MIFLTQEAMFVWLNGSVASALGVRFPCRATIPLSSNIGQVIYSHCLRSFSAPRNWGTKREFSVPKWLWWL